ncbi:hypothetical protein VH569_29340 [Azospirillum sp. 11R-A]|uniref:hypothetical protein n=1 Tax=Azospirillum sp. 11R-A TaxID=3111634 RepID=UPI003C14B96F
MEEKVESRQRILAVERIVDIFKKTVTLICFEFLSSFRFKKRWSDPHFRRRNAPDWLDLQEKVEIVKRGFLKSDGPPKATADFPTSAGSLISAMARQSSAKRKENHLITQRPKQCLITILCKDRRD